MTIGTFATLRAGIALWTHRPDFADTGVNVARTLEFISFGEGLMNRDLARIGAGELASTALTTTAEAIDLPTDFNGMRFLAINGANTKEIQYRPPEVMYREIPSQAAGEPSLYTLRGKDGASDVIQAVFRKIPDAVYTLLAYYYKKIPTLVGGADGSANWMLTNNADAYLAASCIYAARFMRDAEMIAASEAFYAKQLVDIKELDDARRVGGSSPRVSPSVRMLRGM